MLGNLGKCSLMCFTDFLSLFARLPSSNHHLLDRSKAESAVHAVMNSHEFHVYHSSAVKRKEFEECFLLSLKFFCDKKEISVEIRKSCVVNSTDRRRRSVEVSRIEITRKLLNGANVIESERASKRRKNIIIAMKTHEILKVITSRVSQQRTFFSNFMTRIRK